MRKTFAYIKTEIIGISIYLRYIRKKNIKKIIYTITPPSTLKNIGDHAQAVAILKWFKINWQGKEVLEFDKHEVIAHIKWIKKLVTPNDLIFLHSGGNLGDRRMKSEISRRTVIKTFPDNKIIQLPQTIFFSATENGERVLRESKEVYESHNNLTIAGRDEFSFKLAKKYFPKVKSIACPDFVLMVKNGKNVNNDKMRKGVLLCFRKDSESIFNEEIILKLEKIVSRYSKSISHYDTKVKYKIKRKSREKELEKTLEIFSRYEVVITDRYHGIIFALITNTPCIVMKTVDHKLTEAIKWFNKINFVKYADTIEQVEKILPEMLKISWRTDQDWDKEYFMPLANKIKSNDL